MTPAQIKLKRTESILKELIPEAIGQLSDARVREVDVIDIHCSRGRSDAKVYLHPHDYTPQERTLLLKLLGKARPVIEEYCMKDQGWFRSPKLTFVFDDTLERTKNIEALFAQIAKEKKDES
ncbi:MAG: 30S ribosome-binding factor RbfA [Sulfuricurvum sp.]|nr:30S ribosome-binding factor RbfA [Sulfuricurvum sp.]